MPPSTVTAPISSVALLRQLTILSFPPAFILLLIHGIAAEIAFPALGLLPLAASALLGALILHRDQFAAAGSPIQSLSSHNVFIADVTSAVFLLAFLVPSWIMLTDAPSPLIVLGTYGTVFMMLNL